MRQSSCLAEEINTLYVTLQSSLTFTGDTPPDTNISSSGDVSFVMAGFQGLQMYDLSNLSSSLQLQDLWNWDGASWYQNGGLNLFCFGQAKGRAGWNATRGEITLALCNAAERE
jgi:hypothetical protein